MNQVNYQKELDKILDKLPQDKNKKLFLHSCCAPCSSYCLEYLCKYFEITVFYFNPNISAEEEYRKRVAEQIRLIESYNSEIDAGSRQGIKISVIDGDYEPKRFFDYVKGLEDCKEGGERCFKCFELRLKETALKAKELNFDYFGTTLTISPLKNAAKINEIGFAIGEEAGIEWLPSDFKKRNGYLRSIELSAEYDLYRQNFCGCAFSKAEAALRDEAAKR